MERFAKQAVESAHQARLLAEWATSMVDRIKLQEGTPVDLEPGGDHSAVVASHVPFLTHGDTEQKLADSAKCILM